MKIISCEQGSEEWYEAKSGKVSASHFKEVLNKKTGRKTYMMRLLAERITGQRYVGYSDKNMENGIGTEPEAREYYEWVTNEKVAQVGFIYTNDVGASPDGLVGDKGLLEIKCPLTTTHLTYILENRLPPIYEPQVQGQLLITERQWVDFVSFDPQYLKQPFWSIRVRRDDVYLTKLSAALATFVSDLNILERQLAT